MSTKGYAALRRQRQINESTQRTCAGPSCGKSLPVNSHHRRLYCSGQCRLNAQPTRKASGKKRTDYHRIYQERRRRLIAQGRWNPKKGQGGQS